MSQILHVQKLHFAEGTVLLLLNLTLLLDNLAIGESWKREEKEKKRQGQ